MDTLAKITLAATLSLAACTTVSPPPPPKAEPSLTFGAWSSLPVSCQVRGHTADFTFSTTGHVENGTLRLYLTFISPQAGAPKLSISGLAIPFAPEGKSPIYGYTMPFNPAIAARLTGPTSHFNVIYYSVGAPQGYESSLPTADFIQAVSALGATCP